MDKKAISYIFEYSIDLPISFKCDYCNTINDSIHKIVKKHEEVVMVNKDENDYIFDDKTKDIIFLDLENKANKELHDYESLLSKKNYSIIKDNKCNNCNRIATFSIKQAIQTRIILQIICYLVIILASLGLNILLQNLMLALLNNVNNFFTSIWFYPSIFFVVCAIFFIFDVKKIKDTYYKDLPSNLSYPSIYKDKIKIEKKIYLNPKENNFKKH